MPVIATAGHVDHGKTTLIRALTSIDTDRWAEEKRRGLTIDLGFAWTTLPSGSEVSFVDVPGHERFLANTLAGLGPAATVLFVVAADDGWNAQSSDHRDAIAALGISRGIVVITKADLVGGTTAPRVREVITQAHHELASTGLRGAPTVAVSATHNEGIATLIENIDSVVAEADPTQHTTPLRLWVDRAFSMRGAGTIVTGTLNAGSIRTGDRLTMIGPGRHTEVSVRGLQRHGADVGRATPTTRVAVNLRGIPASDIRRGDLLTGPPHPQHSSLIDVHRASGSALTDSPEQVTVHVGTAHLPARVRPLDDDHARLTLDHPLPLERDDRLIIRHPGNGHVIGGAVVLDTNPPLLTRRGAAARRAAELRSIAAQPDPAIEIRRRGAVTTADLVQLGFDEAAVTTGLDGTVALGEWHVAEEAHAAWLDRLVTAVAAHHQSDPLSAGLTVGAAVNAVGLPDPALLPLLAARANLGHDGRTVWDRDHEHTLGPAEAGVAEVERRLAQNPFSAPESDELADLGLGARELAAAERTGRLLRLGDGIVVQPTAPALAMRTLATLDQPFTTSQARQALNTTRRVVIPLLEHCDSRGWTERIDHGHRRVLTTAR